MRIAQIIPSLEARHGGPSKSVHRLSAALARAGHDVILLATGPGPHEIRREGRLVVEIFHRDHPRDFCPSSGLRARLRGLEADIVQHHALWLRTLHYAHQFSTESGARLVISPRGMMNPWSWGHHRWKKKLASRLIHPGALRSADGWHATSEEEASSIASLGFRQPVCLAPNGVDAPTDAESAAAVRHWRGRCPEAAGRPVALFHSRFHRKKRVLELIDLWIAKGPRDWLLLLVGIPEGYTVRQLEDYVIHASGAGRIRVFDGTGEPAPYPLASLFLLPSHSENFGLSIAEALAHGVPALVTDTTPWEGLGALGGGWCVPWAEYPAALQAATAEGADQLAGRGARARAWVLKNYSWDRPAATLIEFYGRLKIERPVA